jgi:transposase
MRARIARDELRRLRELTQAIKALEAEIAELVGQVAPQLLTEPGFGALTAAKLVGEIARRRPLRERREAGQFGSQRSRSVQAGPTDTVSIAAATARSTPRFTASRSPAPAAISRRSSSSRARSPKARPTAKRSAASNDTSPDASGTCSNHPTQSEEHRHHHHFLDIGAAKAAATG